MDAWSRCINALQTHYPSEEIHTWIRPLQAQPHSTATELVLLAPNAFIFEHVSARYLPRITTLFQQIAGSKGVVRLELAPPVSLPPSAAASLLESAPVFAGHNLLPGYTLSNFIVGQNNQMGLTAILQVSRQPGARSHNPLLLYGATGLGKTHLMSALGHRLQESGTNQRVLYLRADELLIQLQRALQMQVLDHLQQHLQPVDVLLLDDVQFLARQPAIQDAFAYTFTRWLDQGKQLIVSCDRYPHEMNGLEARLQSRLISGLSVPIEAPDFATRVAIVHAKARARGESFSHDVARLIAQRVQANIRELEGALNTLLARAQYRQQPLTLSLAQDVLRDLFHSRKSTPSMESVQHTVADYYGLTLHELLSKSRARALARPRQIAMALCKELTDHSLPLIGDAFAGRDHSTVMYAYRKVQALRETDARINDDWNALIHKLKG